MSCICVGARSDWCDEHGKKEGRALLDIVKEAHGLPDIEEPAQGLIQTDGSTALGGLPPGTIFTFDTTAPKPAGAYQLCELCCGAGQYTTGARERMITNLVAANAAGGENCVKLKKVK